jgi:putative heme-binding domain-containing protein
VWVLAQLGPEGRRVVESYLDSEEALWRLLAFRALRFARPSLLLAMVDRLCRDASPAVRREVAVALRDVPLEDCRGMLRELIEGYDGENRWYLEALGIASLKKETEVYRELIRPRLRRTDYQAWDAAATHLAWRFHTPEAIEDLHQVIVAQQPDLETFRHWVMALASFRTDEERRERRRRLEALLSLPAFSGPEFRATVDEILARDLNDLQGEFLTESFRVPEAFGPTTELAEIEVIAALEGDHRRGKEKAAVCLACHRLQGQGVAFGPNLTRWGQERTVTEIVRELIDPSAKLAHGYDRPVRLTAKGGEVVMEGLLSNFSWHAGSLKLKLFGGETKKILFRRSGARVENLENHSWMPSASRLGLEDQDVRDIAAYLQSIGIEASTKVEE